MKTFIVLLLGFFAISCASTRDTENKTYHTPQESLNTPPTYSPLRKQDHHVKRAIVSVALATTIGVVNKEHFECTQDCEKGLKESIENRTNK